MDKKILIWFFPLFLMVTSVCAQEPIKAGTYQSFYESGLFRFTPPIELKGYQSQPLIDGVHYYNRRFQVDLKIRCRVATLESKKIFQAIEANEYKEAFVDGFNRLAEHPINRTRFRTFNDIQCLELTSIDPQQKHLPYTALLFFKDGKEILITLTAPTASFFEGENNLLQTIIKNLEMK